MEIFRWSMQLSIPMLSSIPIDSLPQTAAPSPKSTTERSTRHLLRDPGVDGNHTLLILSTLSQQTTALPFVGSWMVLLETIPSSLRKYTLLNSPSRCFLSNKYSRFRPLKPGAHVTYNGTDFLVQDKCTGQIREAYIASDNIAFFHAMGLNYITVWAIYNTQVLEVLELPRLIHTWWWG